MKTPCNKNILSNERGAMAVLSVVIMSFVVITTLSTVYIYLVNRAKYHSRIREAYQLTHVMEEFGKLTRQAYDTASSLGGAPGSDALCPGPAVPARMRNYARDNGFGVPMCFPPCPTGPAGANCNTSLGSLCISHLGKQYCMNAANDADVVVGLEKSKDYVNLHIKSQENKPITNLDRWYARLDKFFESQIVEPAQMVSKNHLLPALNIPKPSFVAWIERETQAVAGGIVLDGGNLKEEMCGGAAPTNPNCSETRGTAGGGYYAGGGLIGGGGTVTPTPEPAPIEGATIPVAGGSEPPKGGEEKPPKGGGDYEPPPKGGGTPPIGGGGEPQIPPECREGGSGGLGCLQYCPNPNLSYCRKIPSATITVPNCRAGEVHEDCIPCQGSASNTCFRAGFCLPGMVCEKDSQMFTQFFNLIL